MGFRKALIERDLDARLIDRTVEVAQEKGGFGGRKLRAALDSSPCGERAGWKTRTTFWGTPSVRHWT